MGSPARWSLGAAQRVLAVHHSGTRVRTFGAGRPGTVHRHGRRAPFGGSPPAQSAGDTVSEAPAGLLGKTDIGIISVATPAIHGACEAESARALLALQTTKALLMMEPVTVYDVSPGPQGSRFKARVMNGAGVDVGATLARSGYAQSDDDALDVTNPWCR
ncbi:hypothetical protein [Azospirillum soli]|uniref:hypothetical protein n=1 Tax=Azospirillum soli TaxID=1304799 RepID=UPI001AE61945|nr:hypothetical protein [Azospirillum soli]MBP2312927.1 endonuclease YncB(thermonuclease family) [Azospirillum soli]